LFPHHTTYNLTARFSYTLGLTYLILKNPSRIKSQRYYLPSNSTLRKLTLEKLPFYKP